MISTGCILIVHGHGFFLLALAAFGIVFLTRLLYQFLGAHTRRWVGFMLHVLSFAWIFSFYLDERYMLCYHVKIWQ